MKRDILFTMLLALTALVAHAAPVDIPTTDGTYIDWNNATLSYASIENSGKNVGSTGKNTVITFTINNTVEQAYDLTFRTATKNAATMDVTLADANGQTVISENVEIANTNSWYLDDRFNPVKHKLFIANLPVGTYTLTFKTTSTTGSYAGNWGWLAFTKAETYEAVTLQSLTIDGDEQDVTAINASPFAMTISDRYYTAMPKVKATLIDGTEAAVSSTLAGTTATYTIEGCINDLAQTFKLTLDNVEPYTLTENDETVQLKYASAYNTTEGNWDNGLYAISGIGDGWSNSSFKFKEGDYTLSVPADVQVKQLILKDFNANYNGGQLNSVVSEGATVKLPTKHDYQEPDATAYDLTINLVDHQPGTPITFNLSGGGQPVAWLELTIEHVAVKVAPVLKSQSVTNTDHTNHAVVSLAFDRAMKQTTATINGQSVTAEGGSSTLNFAVWNLEYNSTNTLTIAAGAAADEYGNTNSEDINIEIKVGERATVAQAAYDYVVGTVEEWNTALAAVNTSNASAGAARKVIFIKNGEYDFGSVKQELNAYNVSLIGESQSGAVLKGTQDGITNAMLNIKEKTGVYMQDLTLFNYRTYDTDNKRGVSVALSGGNKAVLKHVKLVSTQDTQVTGSRAYYEDCDIWGTVDFICGGGDHYYNRCNLVVELDGSVICAPNTTSANKWGYVFQGCTIKAPEGVTVKDGGYGLGRPWQNEPRTYYLNTIMEVKPNDGGWNGMSQLVTHFYEYNSMDKNGKAIDLSKRTNSSTSTNSYTPVLSDAEAAKFTLENVLGGTDSWLPTEETVTLAAPTLSSKDGVLTWTAVEDARCYVVFKDGQYLTNTTALSLDITEDATYTVRAANRNGGLGLAAEGISTSIGSFQVETDGKQTIYNLQGQRVSTPARGIYIVNGRKIIVR